MSTTTLKQLVLPPNNTPMMFQRYIPILLMVIQPPSTVNTMSVLTLELMSMTTPMSQELKSLTLPTQLVHLSQRIIPTLV